LGKLFFSFEGIMRRLACWSLVVVLTASAARADGPRLSPLSGNPLPNPPAAEAPAPEPLELPLPQNPLAERLKPTFEIRGRIETDAIVAVQSAQSIATIGNLQNGYGFRRLRLGAQGTVGDAVRWESEVELAGGNVSLRDVFIGITALPGIRELRVGNFREPFSLDGATSSRFITFMERSPLNVLDPARNWGICGFWWPDSERALFALGVFRDGTTNGGQSIGDQDAWAVTTKLSGLPVYEPDADVFRLAHLGAAMSFRHPAGGVVNFAPTPQSNLLTVDDTPPSPFLPPVQILANSQQTYNLQAASVIGPFSMQGEWFGSTIQQTNAGVVFVHGFYVDASYFLTGEHRGYDRRRGSFDRVEVRRPLIRAPLAFGGGWGALELAARFAVADFRSSNLPPATDGSSTGVILYQLTLGTNWYLNDYTRFMFNYTAGFPDVAGKPDVSAHIFSARFAIYW
jgi:phosphate-selective porin OprO/OprP